MHKVQKSNTLYATPFSRAYWRDACAELRDTKMLVFAALMIALRLVMKLIYVPLAPGLQINTAFLANALGAMVYGPVMAGLCAIVTDVLGYLINPVGVYFVPFILTEVAGSMIFALFLYRARTTPMRVMLSRFCICFGVNVLLQTPIYMWYYSIFMDGKAYVLTIPGIVKNLFMFPIESVVLTLFLSLVQPVTYQMKLTYNGEKSLHLRKQEVAALVVLFVLGVASVTGYLFYYYDHTSLSASYTSEERVERNQAMDAIVDSQAGGTDDTTMAVVESAYQKFLGNEVTYTVASYAMADGLTEEDVAGLWKLSKSKAAKDENLTRLGTATVVVNKKTDEVLSYEYSPVE